MQSSYGSAVLIEGGGILARGPGLLGFDGYKSRFNLKNKTYKQIEAQHHSDGL